MKYRGIVDFMSREGEGVERLVYVHAENHGHAAEKIRNGVALVYDVDPASIEIYNIYSELEDPDRVLRGEVGWGPGEKVQYDDNPLFLVPEPFFTPGEQGTPPLADRKKCPVVKLVPKDG